jgi:hypothetical protein
MLIQRYVRFADRDMLMRFHWGKGIGHNYAHGAVPCATSTTIHPHQMGTQSDDSEVEDDQHEKPQMETGTIVTNETSLNSTDVGEDPELFAQLGMEDRETEYIYDSDTNESDESESSAIEDGSHSNEIEEMYL